MFEAHIEANMPDDEIAQLLSEDAGWLQAQWPECIRQAEEANETVNGDPSLRHYSFVRNVNDGRIYDFVFNIPVA